MADVEVSVSDSPVEQPRAAQSATASWRVLWKFAVHGTVGTALFAIIATPAVALDLTLIRLKTYGVSIVIMAGLSLAEYSLFALDLILFIVFLYRTGVRTAKQL